MTGEVFNSLWITAFGWGLTENSGAREWTEFVSSPKSNDAALRATLKDFSGRFTAAKSEGRSNYRDLIPTLEEFRRRYFALLPKLRIEWAEKKTRADGGVCRICGGEGIVWGLTPQQGHRGEAPEHVREIPAERLPLTYFGVQAYDCPECRAAAYEKFPELRNRVKRNCLPEKLPPGSPDNPHDYPECGARVILAALKARMTSCRGFRGFSSGK